MSKTLKERIREEMMISPRDARIAYQEHLLELMKKKHELEIEIIQTAMKLARLKK